jgi:uncharacterized membrane protein YfcA
MFAGSTVASTVGFGLAVTASPLMLLVLDPQTVVVVMNASTLAVFLLVLLQAKDHLPLREIAPVTVAGLIGVPAGVVVLGSVSASALRIGIVCLVLALAALVALGFDGALLRRRFVGPPIGLVVGALLAATGIGGPVMALLLLSRRWSPQAIRASLAFYFLVVISAGVGAYGAAGLFTAERAILILAVALPVLAGFRLGRYLVRRMNDRMFRRGVVSVVAVTSLMVLGQELLRLQAPG